MTRDLGTVRRALVLALDFVNYACLRMPFPDDVDVRAALRDAFAEIDKERSEPEKV